LRADEMREARKIARGRKKSRVIEFQSQLELPLSFPKKY